jgi:GNAT superfamily N-acetyltransferase
MSDTDVARAASVAASGPHIRTARPDELDVVADLVVLAYTLGGGMAADDPYLEMLRDAPTRAATNEVLVAVVDGRVCGSLTWCPPGSAHREISSANEGEFRMLAVSVPARGRGVGTALVRHCLDEAARLGLDAVVASSAGWMTQAHRIYQRLGFERTPHLDWQPRPDITLITFRYPIPAPAAGMAR